MTGHPEFGQSLPVQLGAGGAHVIGGDDGFHQSVADQLAHQRLGPAAPAVGDHADRQAGQERVVHQILQPWPGRQAGVEDHLVEHQVLGHADLVGEQFGQHVALRPHAPLPEFGGDPLTFVVQREQLLIPGDPPVDGQTVRGERGVEHDAMPVDIEVRQCVEVEDHRTQRMGAVVRLRTVPPEPSGTPRLLLC